ncbi:MAG: hypothetical protein ABS36_02950 [Acidobacteria bacterium SCN 69-37]|nr:MAG: hypothetical protein ABS36_02950 [Acidobacteria bacterium SCN 69-37]
MTSRLSRRVALRTIATGIGAGVAVPLAAADHATHEHATAEAGIQGSATASTTRDFFSAHQFATLQVLAGLIVPGAQASGTPEFLDKWLAVEPVDARRQFISALGAFDGAAMRAHGRAFKDLAPADQTAILTEASTMAPGTTVASWRTGDPIGAPQPPPEPINLRDYFDHIKGLVADVHFSSEAGLRDLGSTGTLVFPSFPACEIPT